MAPTGGPSAGAVDPFGPVDSGRPLVGMVHLPALPGSPGYDPERGREAIRDRALQDARALVEGGMDAVLVENLGDAPYHPDRVPAHVVADVTSVAGAVARAVEVPVGVNVLRNDVRAALSAAAAAGGRFVRANVHAGTVVTDQGTVEGRAHETLRLRDRIDADVAVLADVDVKHATALDERSPATAAEELVDRARADGVVVSGRATGEPTDPQTVRAVRAGVDRADRSVPVLVGSGVTPDSVADLIGAGADGAIVGTALKREGVTSPVDPDRVAELVGAAREF